MILMGLALSQANRYRKYFLLELLIERSIRKDTLVENIFLKLQYGQ